MSFSYKINHVIVIKNFLNPEGHKNPISGSKVPAILLKGWILPICIEKGLRLPFSFSACLFVCPHCRTSPVSSVQCLVTSILSHEIYCPAQDATGQWLAARQGKLQEESRRSPGGVQDTRRVLSSPVKRLGGVHEKSSCPREVQKSKMSRGRQEKS